MTDEVAPERRKATKTAEAERDPLRVTVLESAAADAAVEAPPRGVEIPPYAKPPRVSRWYWILLVLAAAMLFASYKFQYASVLRYAAQHRWLPRRIVRFEHSLERHLLGERFSSKPALP